MLPDEFKRHNMQVCGILKKLAGKLEIKNANERKKLLPRQAVLNGQEFKDLWNRIKYKTTYRVQFDNDALLKNCIKAIENAPPISKACLKWRKADLAIGRAGVEANETAVSDPIILTEGDIELPDILTELQDITQLTRRTIALALIDSGRLEDFKSNPQQFIQITAKAINRAKRLAIVDGIKYQRLGEEYCYVQELFEQEELNGYLKSMLFAKHGVHESLVYHSDTERNFAEQLNKNESVKVFAKLPGWFQLPTPLGPYNPDWAVLVEQDGVECIYFVVEAKSSLFVDVLRDNEGAKIDCGEAHFKASD